MPCQFELESLLCATVEAVGEHICRMSGVNAELAPWIRMTCPDANLRLSSKDTPTGVLLFRSLILLLGVLPVDWHFLRLIEIDNRSGFVEESSSLAQRRWRHERRLADVAGRCRITDRVEFEPRLPLVGRLLLPVVRAVFNHRHRQLRRMFGEGNLSPG